MPRSPRPRIDDVAERAGVSKTAVSFAFNQPENLNPATRDRILQVAAELGYRPSPIARRLTARRTDQIGLVVPQSTHDVFANPFYAELLRGIGDVCDPEGISVVIVPPVHGSIGRAVSQALVDGMILVGLAPNHPELAAIRRAGMPLVALDVDSWDGVDIIGIDDAGGGEAAARHLAELGHTEVATILISAHPDTAVDQLEGISARRLSGIRAGLGIPAGADSNGEVRVRILAAPVSEEGGHLAFEELAAGSLPTAVITMSDVVAIGLLAAAREAGVGVPDELSVIGYDDIPAAGWSEPALTTVHQPIRDKGRRAARRLITLLRADAPGGPFTETLPTHLVVRGSTAPPPAAHAAARPVKGGAAAV